MVLQLISVHVRGHAHFALWVVRTSTPLSFSDVRTSRIEAYMSEKKNPAVVYTPARGLPGPAVHARPGPAARRER